MTSTAEIKTVARKTWAAGDYRTISQFLPPVSSHLVRAAGIKKGDAVLDVACGTGITAITAARTGAQVTGLDLTPDLLAVAEDEAALARLENIQWREGDAEAMPFPDASFDCVLSSFGHMFTPDPAAAAGELVRVTKPRGVIAFTTWPPESTVGQMFQVVGSLLPPPPGTGSPPQWGDPEIVRDRLGSAVSDIRFEQGTLQWPTLSPGHLWTLFRETYGPFLTLLDKLGDDPAKKRAFADKIQSVFAHNFHDNTVAFDYLLTRATRR